MSKLLSDLIEALRCLPGVGGKSAQRMAFHLLERERERGLRLAAALEQAMQRIGRCTQCRNFSEEPLCTLDGLGPEELGLAQLAHRLGEGEIEEMIIATNPTVEGEATAHYLAQLARAGGVRPTRLAHGVPLGGELEYVDRSTLAHAFGGRQALD
jgi:recombination protein RecR